MLHTSTHRLRGVLHFALGLIIAAEGVLNLIHGLAVPRDPQLIAFGAAEGAGALLFMWPRAAGVGECVLVCAFLVAAAVHLVGFDFPSEHLVYAVAVLLVGTHNSGALAPPAHCCVSSR